MRQKEIDAFTEAVVMATRLGSMEWDSQGSCKYVWPDSRGKHVMVLQAERPNGHNLQLFVTGTKIPANPEHLQDIWSFMEALERKKSEEWRRKEKKRSRIRDMIEVGEKVERWHKYVKTVLEEE